MELRTLCTRSTEPARRFLWAPGLRMILYPDGNSPALGNSRERLFALEKTSLGLAGHWQNSIDDLASSCLE